MADKDAPILEFVLAPEALETGCGCPLGEALCSALACASGEELGGDHAARLDSLLGAISENYLGAFHLGPPLHTLAYERELAFEPGTFPLLPPSFNRPCGKVTTSNAALAAGARVSFLVTNSVVAAADVVVLNFDGFAAAATYRMWVDGISAGIFRITMENISGGSLSEALSINFAVMKAVTA